jgi:hypothetical protein
VKRPHHIPEQVVRKVAEGQKLLAEGKSVDEARLDPEALPVGVDVGDHLGCRRSSFAPKKPLLTSRPRSPGAARGSLFRAL